MTKLRISKSSRNNEEENFSSQEQWKMRLRWKQRFDSLNKRFEELKKVIYYLILCRVNPERKTKLRPLFEGKK